MKIRSSIFRAPVLALIFSALAASESEADVSLRRPNILLILADDLGYGEPGCQGGTDAPTPNLDAMAKSGTRFMAGYVTSPVCSPTRAGLLTGRYQQRFGHENNIGQSWEVEHGELLGLPIEEKTIADHLKTAGYRTACIGKWHLGAHQDFHPLKRGFDQFFGFLEGGRAYLADDDPENFYLRPEPPFDTVRFRQRGKAPIYRDQTIVEEKEYLTDAFTREALRFVDANPDQPFFLYLTYNAVHTPITPCARWETRLRHIENPVRRAVASMMAAMDENIGKLRAHLQERGLADNTLLIFLSDNGGSPAGNHTTKGAGTAHYSLNTPLRGFKGECWEGGIRIPFLMEWPAKLPRGKTFQEPVSSLDILPTALAAAGASPLKTSDGVDLIPYLTGKQTGAPHATLFWRFHIYKAVRKGSWKLVQRRNEPAQLFDLEADVSESIDRAPDRPEVLTELTADLAAWERQMCSPRWDQKRPLRPDGRPLFPAP